ncbi:MAG: Hsp20 family protein [Pseudomonadota bacterium]
MSFALVASRAYPPSYRSLDRRFARFFDDTTSGLQVAQDENGWTVSLDLPGIAREELSFSIEGAVVRIETKAEAKRQFKVAYELPADLDADASSAALKDGVLTLKLVKSAPVSKARTIEIK